MAILTTEVLKKIINELPGDYTIEYENHTTAIPIYDRIEIDVTEKLLILK